MILFPAIDLKDGRCVRLKRGEMKSATVFNDDPAAQALAFKRAGFQWLHCVDLDGAFAGKPANAASIRAIRAAIEPSDPAWWRRPGHDGDRGLARGRDHTGDSGDGGAQKSRRW